MTKHIESIMSRILAIDCGQKRTGLAVSDPLQIIASSLGTIRTMDLLEYLENYFKIEKVETIVIGYPLNLDGSGSESLRYINPILKRIQKLFPDKKIVQFDERYTSKLAHETLIASGLKKKDRQNKALIDTISANIILQDYLKSIKI